MTTDRFDQGSGDYGRCGTCGVVFPSEGDMHRHLMATFDEGRGVGHSGRVTNPTRRHRITDHVDLIVDRALNGVVEQVLRLIDAGDITRGEALDALSWHPDFHDAFEEADDDE